MSTEHSGVTTGQPNLQKQDLSKLDISKLTALSPEVISRQATINIGTIGHVAHGKSTVVKAISGVQTVRFKNELERNITIKLDNLQYNDKGRITWPPSMRGMKIHSVVVNKNSNKKKILEQKPQLKHHRLRPKRTFRQRRIAETSSSNVNNTRHYNAVYSKRYQVERILEMKFDKKIKEYKFHVKWHGYDSAHNTWEVFDHFKGSEELLCHFIKKYISRSTLKKLGRQVSINIDKVTDDILLSVVPNIMEVPKTITVQKEILQYLNIMTPSKIKAARRALLMYLLINKRQKQMERMKLWEIIINRMDNSTAILKVENNVDLEFPPENFNYINAYVPIGNIVIPNMPDVHCECVECGPKFKACCGKQDHFYNYTSKLRVNVHPGNAIYECNKFCKCNSDCRNRIVQNGRKIPLCIFRTANGCGWGVKTLQRIFCGEFVCEYVGEVIDNEEAERRGTTYDANGRTYLFDLDYHSKDNLYTVDAGQYGNVSHFINHSCDPNLSVYATYINCLDPNIPHLALFALREIRKNEELTFDYMMNIDSPTTVTEEKTPEKNRLKLDSPDKNVDQAGRPTCKCAADNCRRYLF